MAKMHELFGSNVFNDAVMQERLPKDTYKALKKTIDEGRRLDPDVAAVVAHAMKDWAVEKGVTHYTHWFQPMTGITAEKHDSFISPKDGGQIILQKAVEVHDGDTPEILQRRVMEEAEWKIMPKAIDLIAAGCVKVVDGHVIIEEETA